MSRMDGRAATEARAGVEAFGGGGGGGASVVLRGGDTQPYQAHTGSTSLRAMLGARCSELGANQLT